ncbi:MAG: hypothetical protein QOK37_2044 [Thermoanaerobaculia bacterium]|nr:hypothetical protein [Thermoanaerobaculia bacterium]
MKNATAIFTAGVLLASVGQLLMKKGALRGRRRSLLESFCDPFTIAGYTLMVCSTVTSTIALKTLPLKDAISLQPLGYILVVILSMVVLREKMARRQAVGLILVLAGMIIFNLEGS